MYVGLRMMTDFVRIPPDAPINEAFTAMKAAKSRMVMVVEGEKLIGIASEVDLRRAMPSSVTTLEIHELTYLLSRITMKDVMTKSVLTVSPETPIEEAALLMHDKDVSGLPVVGRDGRLVGLINRTIMLEVLVEEMGLYMGGVRLTFEVEDRPGQILEISTLLREHGCNVISVATFGHWEAGKRIVVFRINGDESASMEQLFRDKGYRFLHAGDFGF
jgi:acetoin utilization protein AcuB